MKPVLVRILFAVTILISVADQIPLHNTRWVPDESWYADAGKTLMQEGRLRLSSFPPSDPSSRVDTRPPAMSAALALSFKLFGVGLWQARLPSYAARTGAILIVFLLGIRYGGLLAGLLAAALLLSDNYLFVAGRTARPEALVTLFLVLTLWLYHQARERKSLLFTFLASLAAAGAMAFHVAGFAAVLTLGLLLLLELRFSVWKSARAWCFALHYRGRCRILCSLGSFRCGPLRGLPVRLHIPRVGALQRENQPGIAALRGFRRFQQSAYSPARQDSSPSSHRSRHPGIFLHLMAL